MSGTTRALVASFFILAQIVSVSAQGITALTTFASPTTELSPYSTATSEPKVIDVTVNKGSTHRFNPEEIAANVGDTISFHFFPTNHSVVKAEYGYPCVPYNYVEPGSKDMFFSGNRPMKATDEIQVWNLTVNSTEPTFFYCSAIQSCNGEGMLGVINPNKTMTLKHQRELALDPDTIQLSPGDPIPAEASSTIVHSSTAPTSTSSSAVPTATLQPDHSDHGHHGLSGGAIAGIAVAGVAAVLICGLLFFYIGRTKSLKEVLKRNSATVPVSQTPQDPGFGTYGFVPQNDYRQSHLPPYGSPYNGPPSEVPGSPGFTANEFAGARATSPRPASMHKASGAHTEPASPRPQQQDLVELA